MEQASAQTEKIATYETSRTRRSIVDGNLHSDDSNDDEEFASSGFYVREKTSDKKSDSSGNGTKADIGSNENGIESEDNRSQSPLLNGENSKDGGDNSRNAKPTTEEKTEGKTKQNSENKEVIQSKTQDECEQHADDEIIQSSSENIEDNSVSSSSNNQTLENVCSSSNDDEENDVTSTSNNVDEPKTVESEAAENSHKSESVEPKEATIIEEPATVDMQETPNSVNKLAEAKNVDDTDLVESKTDEPKETGSKEVEADTAESTKKEKTVESEEPEVIEKSKDVPTIDESKTVDQSEEVEIIDEPKTIKAKQPEEVEIMDEPKTVKTKQKKNVEQSEEVEIIDEPKTVKTKRKKNVEQSEEVEIIDEPKTIKAKQPEEVEIMDEPKTVKTKRKKNVEQSEEVEIIDEPKTVKTKRKKNVDQSEEVEITDEPKTVKTKQMKNVDESKGVESEEVQIIADEPQPDKNKSKEDDVIEIDDKNDKEEKKSDKESTTEEKSSAGASILKGQLERTPSGNDASSEHDIEMDEDFDPSLLCPDISMDVDEAPVMTNSAPDDGSTSPLPYEPIFSTLVDEITGAEVQIDLTPAEMEMRQKMYGPNNPVQTTKVHCTACNVHLGSALTGANNRFVHPLLKVLICKNCYHFYTSGEFEKDEDGSELYCRWCGQGGQVLCCSSCEFVFCKRCIRNNFGPKKFKEIRDSDDWNCFRCEPEQLSSLRASCAEFMEYYRTELARAHALASTNPELMTTDYTKCCSSTPEKKEEPKPPATQKAKRKRKEEDDPDYEPKRPEEEPPPTKKLATTSTPSTVPSSPSVVRPIVPKPFPNPVAMRHVATASVRPPPTTTNQVFKVGNTTFRSRAPGYAVQKPGGQGPKNSSPGYVTIPPSSAPKTTTPGYIKILPQRLPSPSRPPGSYTVVSGTSNGKPTFSTVRPPKPPQPPSMAPMKHEWFEKTVRAAARVNSNLSYTLTQLNRQQSQATSVEALAMVHNKLQEVLSTSINSLIQIRKNLRTEFIAGIKNIKFPPKTATIPSPSVPIVVKDDDDVIFVNPTSTASQSQPPPLVLSPSVTLTKKTPQPPQPKNPNPFSNPTPSTSGVKPNNASKPIVSTTPASSSGPVKGGFLKVRSLTALQSVPSECITIPDDPPKRQSPGITIVEEEDPLKMPESDPLKSTENVSESKLAKTPGQHKKQPQDKEISSTSSSKFNPLLVYNVKEPPPPEIKKMMDAVVMLHKSPHVDELLASLGLLVVNGASDSVKKQKVAAAHKEVEPL